MTILEAIDEAHEATGIITPVSFANIKEFQSFLDSFSYDKFPINVVVPFTSNGTHISGRRKAVIPLQGWILTMVNVETLDLRSRQAEEFVEPMRHLAIKFLNRLLDTEVTDPEVEEVSDTIVPEYAFLSQKLFGVSYTMNWPVVENVCIEP